jgi:multiple sugar transport system permease protein
MSRITSHVTVSRIATYLVLAVFLILFLFPIYWMFLASLRDNPTVMSMPPRFAPSITTLENYRQIFSTPKYLTYIKNSLIVAVFTVLISVCISTMASFALSRYTFPLRKLLLGSLLSVQMFPIVAILISLFTFFSRMKLTNNYLGLILADISMSLPLAIWMLKSFFDSVPRSLDESAAIDGCGRFRIMVEIVFPLIKPGVSAVAIYTFLKSWDDYMFGLVLMNKNAMKTLPVGIAESFMGEFVHNYAGMMTLAFIASLPLLLLFVFFQRYMIAGLTGGAVKE